MPPSGFSNSSIDGLEQFLMGCFQDLEAEVADGKHASLEAGIAFEISQIDKALAGADRDDIRASLLLVQSVYKDALTAVNEQRTIEEAVAACGARIGRLHITPDGQLTER